jgi:hypothetical protein
LKTCKETQENAIWEPTKIKIFCGVTRVGWLNIAEELIFCHTAERTSGLTLIFVMASG